MRRGETAANVNSESLNTIRLTDYSLFFTHFATNGTLELYNERVLEFEDWAVSIPFITNDTVLDPIEATLDFFSTPQELRHKPYPRNGDFREPGRPFAQQFLRSYLERSQNYERHHMVRLNANRRVGMYVSVQLMRDNEPLINIGH